jgi:heterodisulfide reductase subunit A
VLLSQGQVELEPFVAKVDPQRCDGAGQCVAVCRYEDAISLQPTAINGQMVNKATIVPANCAGCGSCVSACPNGAIDLQGWTLAQYDAMVDALVVEPLPVLEFAR